MKNGSDTLDENRPDTLEIRSVRNNLKIGLTPWRSVRNNLKIGLTPWRHPGIGLTPWTIGNIGAHAGNEVVDYWDAESLDDFLRWIVDFLYVVPGEIERLGRGLNPKCGPMISSTTPSQSPREAGYANNGF